MNNLFNNVNALRSALAVCVAIIMAGGLYFITSDKSDCESNGYNLENAVSDTKQAGAKEDVNENKQAIDKTVSLDNDTNVKETSYILQEEKSPVTNPYKGFIQYIYDANLFDDGTYGIKVNPDWELTDVVYARFNWTTIEKSKGSFNWAPLDNILEQCKKHGKKLAFGIMPANSGGNKPEGCVPQYVYDSGCKYVLAKLYSSMQAVSGTQRTPEWSDPKYISAANDFTKALADKYDNNDNIAFIDIRTFGNWGEGHVSGLEGSTMPSDDILKNNLKVWAECFKNTKLVVPVNGNDANSFAQYAVSLGISLRRDGIMVLKDTELAVLPASKAGMPTVGEFYALYQNLKNRNAWNTQGLRKVVDNADFSYLALGSSIQDGYEMYNENKEFFREMQNYLGYNFVAEEATLKCGDNSAKLDIKIKNTGVTSQSFDAHFKAAITDKNGEVIKLLSAEQLVKQGKFASSEEKTISIEFSKDELKEGKYIAVGIFEDSKSDKPQIKFANKNTAANKYLILGQINNK